MAGSSHSMSLRISPRLAWVLGLALYAIVTVALYRVHAPDLLPVWQAAHAFVHGQPPYYVPLFVYPPSALVLFAPLGLLPLWAAAALFLVISAVAMAFAAVLVLRIFGVSASARAFPLLIAVLAASAPVERTLYLGNVNGLVALGECAAIWAAARQRWSITGWLLGITLAIKPVLAPLVIVPVLWRRPGAVVRALAIPIVVSLGALALSSRSDEFFSITVPFLVKGNAAGLQVLNVSLAGAGHILGAPSALTIGLRAAVVLGAAYSILHCLHSRPASDLGMLIDVTGIILVATFLAFSFSWNYYALYLLPLYVGTWLGRSAARRRLVAVSAALVLLPDVLLWKRFGTLGAELSSLRVTAGFVVLLASLVPNSMIHPAAARRVVMPLRRNLRTDRDVAAPSSGASDHEMDAPAVPSDRNPQTTSAR